LVSEVPPPRSAAGGPRPSAPLATPLTVVNIKNKAFLYLPGIDSTNVKQVPHNTIYFLQRKSNNAHK